MGATGQDWLRGHDQRRKQATVLVVGESAAGVRLQLEQALEPVAAIKKFSGQALPPEHLPELVASDVVALALGPEGFSANARRTFLLALHCVGVLPIIVPVSRPENFEPVLQAMRAYASSLSAPGTPIVAEPAKLAEAVDQVLRAKAESRAALPFRMWLQPGQEAAAESVAGVVATGTAKKGLQVVSLPSAKTAVITQLTPSADRPEAETVHVDPPLTVRYADVLATADARPELADQVAAHVVWLAAQPLLPGRSYMLRLGNQSATAQVSALKHKINPVDLDPIAARRLEQGEVGLCNLSFGHPIVFDQAAGATPRPPTSRFALEDATTGDMLGIGHIAFTLRRATNIHWQELATDKLARAQLKDQRPCCLWFTGLSGSGKSTVASLLEKRLNSMGRHTYTLDGDNVRHGLNRDLGFTDADRVENIRRVAEVSKLFVDAGLIVMVSFISPFRAERAMARALYPEGEFLEIFLDTPIDVCERRDPKGLYKKARAGQLKNFTGIDSPYEPPERAEICLNSAHEAPEALVAQLMRELTRRGMI